MPLIERLKDLTKNPIDPYVFENSLDQEDMLVRKFLASEISLKEFKLGVIRFDNLPYQVLPFPGPLGGICIKIAREFGEKLRYMEMVDVLDEERLHFEKAHKLGLNPKIRIYFTGIKKDEGYSAKARFAVIYDLPPNVSPKEALDLMTQVLLAPPNPSPHDLAKIPPSGV